MWWQSNGTTDCLMTVSFYEHWDNSSAPSDCDGATYLGSPGTTGYYSWGSLGLVPGMYYMVWYNLSPSTATLVTVTEAIIATS